MPQKIRLLDETTINQIAAGEVIESPASVVKELVENALDAGATEISLFTEGGTLVIADNGCGMARDDLLLALERHATSKIVNVDDLHHLSTMGFRGEALPSIASISKMRLITMPREGGEGTQLEVEGGALKGWKVAARQPGTTVEVRSLFYNVPARKKFQKGKGAITGEIHKTLTKIALAHPEVAFTWDDFSLPATDSLGDRIEALFGKEFADNLVSIDASEGEWKLSGFLSKASFHRPNRLGQYLLVNGRPVVSPFVAKHILAGYGTRLPTHRYPAFVLNLHLPPALIDPNVHPQKKEIRLRKEEKLAPFLVASVESTFQMKRKPVTFSAPAAIPPSSTSFHVAEEPVPYTQAHFFEPPRILTTFGRFIFVEGNSVTRFLPDAEERIVLVDQKRARSRLFYNKTVAEGAPPVQRLLLPLTLEFSREEKEAIEAHNSLLDRLGLSLRPFGGNAFLVDAIPTFLDREGVHAFLSELVEMKGMAEKEGEKRVIAKLCRSIRVKPLGTHEAERLVETLFEGENFHESPQGKPTYTLLSEEDLEKRFT